MLYEILQKNYQPNELFSLEDVYQINNSKNNRQQLAVLVKQNKLRRYVNGMYYFPEYIFGIETYPTIYDYIRKKYLKNGFIGGIRLANTLGFTTQNEMNSYTIYSNETTSSMRNYKIRNYQIIVKKPYEIITEKNMAALKILTVILDDYTELEDKEYSLKIQEYITKNNIPKKQLLLLAEKYPNKIYKNLYKSGVIK